MIGRIIIDRFDTTEHITGKYRTYEAIKTAVLRAGMFSVFEATSNNKNASIFTRLCQDPEIETFQMGFPWTGVRLATSAARIAARSYAADFEYGEVELGGEG